MNPSDYGMLWMGQFGQDRILLDDSSILSVGMSVMDDIGHHTHSMDLNPLMGNVTEYTAVTAPGPIAMTPDIVYPITTATHPQFEPTDLIQQQQLQQQQTMLGHYSLDEDEDDDEDDNSNGMMQHQQTYEDNDDDDEMEHDPDQYVTAFDSDPDNGGMILEEEDTVEKAEITARPNKKIKPVKRPGLVLKTPIAYQPCLDPSVIPIQRDGMAVCERCGAIGVKHSFYTKERRFCSMACARNELERLSYSSNNQQSQSQQQQHSIDTMDQDIELELTANQVQNPNYRFKMTPRQNDPTLDGIMYKDLIPQDELPQICRGNRLPSPCPQDEKILSIRRKPSEFYNSFDWNSKLSSQKFVAAPVTCFKHAPGYEMWTNIVIGMKVEVENTDCDNQGVVGVTPHSFWVAAILKICGYKALMRYEGFQTDGAHDFWVNLCSSEVHPVGWCATRGKPLIPPRSIEKKFADWKDYLVKHLSGARTLPSTFYNKISDSFKSRFRVGLQLEVVDKNRISQVKLATVIKIVGKRLFVKYHDAPPEDNGFWCHEDSSLIHPVGWAATVGHNLAAPQDYLDRMQVGPDQMIEIHEDDSGVELFKMNFTFEEYYLEEKSSNFSVGMKLEAIDPLNLSSICVATVMAVLKFGYIMIRIDSYDPDATGADWFCYHERSPCIFPPGFCYENGIDLTPPRGFESGFSWDEYLARTKSIAAETHLFVREIPAHGFCVGHKVECADLMDPRLVCVATISKVVGRLLKVHFDGWEDEYDQWLDCESPDMYPVGWCVLVSHKLEGPRVLPKGPALKISPKSNRRKRKKKIKMDNGKSTVKMNLVKKEKDIMVQQHRQTNNSMAAQIDENDAKPSIDQHDTSDYRLEDIEIDDKMLVEEQIKPLRSTVAITAPITTTAASITPTMVATATVESRTNSNATTEKPSKHSSNSTNSSTVSQTHSAPPPERKATSYINNSTVSSSKLIPRLTDSPEINTSELDPSTWNIYDVGQFLRVNDCAIHCDTFCRSKIDGNKMLQLTKDDIIRMLGMKVGPSLKIFDLIQQLKCKLNPQQSRLMKSKINKKYL